MSQEFIDFLKEHFNIVIYLIGLVISVLHYKKYFDTVLKFFPIIIAYTFFNELLGYFIRYSDRFAFFSEETTANDLLYNVYALIFFGYFYFIYYKLVENAKYKKVIKALALIALFVFIVHSFFLNPLKFSLYYGLSLACFILVIVILIYFKNRKEWNWSEEKYNLVTWVSGGLGIFYFLLPIFYLIGYFYPNIWIDFPLRIMIRVLIVVMYSLFCIGFITSRRRAFR